MSYPVITFKKLLWDLAYAAGINPDAAADAEEPGETDFSGADKAMFTAYLNQAMEWAWKPDGQSFAWPFTLTGANFLTPTGGVIPWSDVQESTDWYSGWDDDPRAAAGSPLGTVVNRIELWEEADGLRTRDAESEVYILWRMPWPEFTYTLVNTGSTYNTVGTLVYDEAASGHVYKSIAAGALGNALTDTSKWAVQGVPKVLVRPLWEYANSLRLRAKGTKVEGRDPLTQAIERLDELQIKVMTNAPPWAFNHVV